MREKVVEQQLVKAVRRLGGLCPKFVSPGMDGMPDRLLLMPGGRIAFVEVKAPGKKPRALQIRRHEQLRSLGFPVFVLDDPAVISALLEEIIASGCHSERSEESHLPVCHPERSEGSCFPACHPERSEGSHQKGSDQP